MRSDLNLVQKRAQPYLFLFPALLIIVALLIWPLVLGIWDSLQNDVLFNPLDKGFTGLANYAQALKDAEFWNALKNTVVWTLGSLIFQFVFGLLLALLLRNTKFRLKNVYQAIAFLPWAIPPFLSAMVWSWLYNDQFGPINRILLNLGWIHAPITFLASSHWSMWAIIVANIWFGIPFFAIILLSGLQNIPDDLYEAAAIDGSSKIRQFFHITLPALKPVIILGLLLRTIWIANFADFIFVMTGGGPAGSTETLAMYIFNVTYTQLNFGYAAALSTILFLILLVYAMVFLKVTSEKEVKG